VRRPARIQISVAHLRLKRRRLPQLQRIRRLHIVVPVTQHRRLARRMHPVGINQRMFRRRNDLDILQPRRLQAVRDKLRRALHVRLVFRKSADRRNTEEGFQFIKEAIFIRFDKSVGGLGHPPLCRNYKKIVEQAPASSQAPDSTGSSSSSSPTPPAPHPRRRPPPPRQSRSSRPSTSRRSSPQEPSSPPSSPVHSIRSTHPPELPSSHPAPMRHSGIRPATSSSPTTHSAPSTPPLSPDAPSMP